MSNGMGRLTAVAAGFLLGVAVLSAALGASAQAGQYHVYTCRTPDGAVAPVDGWSEAVSTANDHTSNTCASGGGLAAALNAGHAHAADTDLATWAFNAPAGETLGAATVWRAGDTAGGSNLSAEASYMFWFAGVANNGNTARPFDICEAINGCTGRGNLKSPLAANNRLEVPSGALNSPYLSLNASCGSLIGSSVCPNGGGDENGNAAVVELFAADLILNDEAPPTVEEVKGPLTEASTVSGTTDIALTAGDGASGVYEAVFQVDGATVQKTVLDTNGGHCHDVGETTDGLPAFLYTRPCAATASADVPFDTTGLSDGSHHVVVSVSDAAGNTTPALDRQVTVANHTSSPGGGEQPGGGGAGSGQQPGGSGANGQPGGGSPTGTGSGTLSGPSLGATGAAASPGAAPERGAPNGNGASDQATLTARWKGAGVHLKSAYGRPHTLEGRLSAPSGTPIAGASVTVSDLPSAAGAHASGLPALRTDAAGRFTLHLPRTMTSAALGLAYRSHLADTTPVASSTLTLAVTPTLQLHVTPTQSAIGHTIYFKGRVLGGAIPPGGKQLVLEAHSPGNPWIQFNTIRTTPQGAFRASYRFHLPGPVPYTFRVISHYEADYPFLAGTSNVVGVLER
jgi:hypothetical protein